VTEEAIAFTMTVARTDKDFGGEVHQYGHTWTTTDDDLFQQLKKERSQQEVDAEGRVLESHPTTSRNW